MKRFALLLAAPLLAALLAMLTGTGRVAAADPPDPDLTGDWYGNFEPNRDPEARDEAALRVDAQDGWKSAALAIDFSDAHDFEASHLGPRNCPAGSTSRLEMVSSHQQRCPAGQVDAQRRVLARE